MDAMFFVISTEKILGGKGIICANTVAARQCSFQTEVTIRES